TRASAASRSSSAAKACSTRPPNSGFPYEDDVNSKLGQPWIPIDRIETFIQPEPALVIFGLALGALLVYKLLLREVSEERHRNIERLFTNLAGPLGAWIALLLLYSFLRHVAPGWLPLQQQAADRLASYAGMVAIFSGATVFVKTWRILVFEY